MGAIERAAPDLSWFTRELQDELLVTAATGMKVKWVALHCGVAPKALVSILDMGSRRDSGEPFRSFFRRWMNGRAALMKAKHDEWAGGNSNALTFLKECFPDVYGKDAEPDYQPFQAGSVAEELAQLKAIIDNPADFGPDILELFRAAGRLKEGEG